MELETFRRWERDHPFAKPTPEELELLQRTKPRLRFRLRPLPQNAFRVVFHFLPLYPERMVQDVLRIKEVLDEEPVDNGLPEYFQSGAVLGRLESLAKALEEHIQEQLDLFGNYAAALKLPRAEPHPERDALAAVVSQAQARHAQLHSKWSIVHRWQEFHASMQNTSVMELRPTVRRSVRDFVAEADGLRNKFPEDCVVTKLLTELAFMLDKVSAIEALGDPALTEDDFRGIFWRLDLKYPDLPEYHRSITFQQAMALSLFDGNPIYLWEGKMPVLPALDSELLVVDAQAEIVRGAEEAAKRAEQEAADRLLERQKAATVAADLMKQGCEVCQSNYITWVALGRREGCDAIVLCDDCYATYSENASVYKLYKWHFISELVDEHVNF